MSYENKRVIATTEDNCALHTAVNYIQLDNIIIDHPR